MLECIYIVTRLGVAALIGGAIGLNRYLHHKSTGLRTLGLVACGAAGLVLAAGGDAHADSASRVIQGILTGVGFIGAGVILRDRGDERVHGLTTAAAVWVTAAVGAVCGAGAWQIIVVLSLLVAIILLVGGPIERWFERMFDGKRGQSP
jgi:putative Mg2+ transporter-C (MgtC) family protein